MKYHINLYALLILSLLSPSISKSQEYQINDTYGVNIWEGLHETFDSQNSKIDIIECSGSLIISMTPMKPLNASKYSLYTEEGVFLKNAYNDFQFWNVPTGNFIVKDGDLTIFSFSHKFENKSSEYEVVLTNENYEEITDFTADHLNSIEIRAAIRNTENNQIDSCAPYLNWRLNNEFIRDINSALLIPCDTIDIGIDGVESCTDGCFSLLKSTIIVNPPTRTASASICEGDTFIFGSQNLIAAGEYTEVFHSGNECDSIVALNLTVNPMFKETASATICVGESYVFGLQTLTTQGEYTEVFQSSNGCDSTVVLTLSLDCILGLDKKSKTSNMSIYPNPILKDLNISFKESFLGSIELLDLTGKVIISRSIINAKKFNISLVNVSSGTFILKVKDSSGNVIYHRILKK